MSILEFVAVKVGAVAPDHETVPGQITSPALPPEG